MGGAVSVAALPRVGRSTTLALLAGLGVLGLIFHDEIAAAVGVWVASTAYNHCFLVLPIAAYMVWDRRASLAGVPVRPMPWVAFAAFPVGAVWLVADRLGIMEGRQLAAMGLVELLVLAILGWRMYGRLAAPLLYLFFLVPFGGFLVPWLQTITTRFIDFGLSLTSLPYFIDNYVIEIPEGTFFVAEACAGLRFLIASIAFGVLYAVLIYRSWLRRAVFIAVSIVVPVVANGLRGLGIVWLGHLMGSAQAAAADHLVYGWIFFSAVILLLVLLGLPFRQDIAAADVPAAARPVAIPSPPASPGASLRAAGLLAGVALLGPLVAGWLDRSAAGAAPVMPPARIAGCKVTPSTVGLRGGILEEFSCEQGAILLRIALFGPRTSPGLLIAEQRRLTEQADGAEVELSRLDVPGSDVPWRLAVASEPSPGAAVSALWIDGQPVTGGVRTRLEQALNSLRGGRYAPVIVAAALNFDVAEPGPRRDWPEERLRSFLASHADLSAVVRDLTAPADAKR